MKLSLLLMVVMAIVVLQVFVGQTEAAAKRLQRRPTAVRTARSRTALAQVARRRSSPRTAAQKSRAARARTALNVRRKRRKNGRRVSAVARRPVAAAAATPRRGRRVLPRKLGPKKTPVKSQRPRDSKKVRSNYNKYKPKKINTRYNSIRGSRQEDGTEEDANENVEEEEEEEEVMDLDTLQELMEEGPADAIEAEAMMEALEDAMEDPVKRQVVDANGDGVPDWCNPVKPMGAWLNFRNMRLWCADRGWTNFGPYGGVPDRAEAAAPAEDEAADAAAADDQGEEPVEEAEVAEEAPVEEAADETPLEE